MMMMWMLGRLIPTLVALFFTVSSVVSDAVVSSPTPQPESAAAFKPSVAVIVAVLTTLFSVTFLLLMYAKHCRARPGPEGEPGSYYSSSYYYSRHGRWGPNCPGRNSGIDPVIIESLPVFRFKHLRGEKSGLECAVCLTRFEPEEILRLLPKCRHAFHVECVDTWLDAHSTCPLCRFRVDPEDVLLVVEPDMALPESTNRVSGRHSSAGEKGRASATKNNVNPQTTSCRRSLDGSIAAVERRKDGMLLTVDKERRVDHKIVIDDDHQGGGPRERWSDAQPYDLFYLRSEMLMNEGRRSTTTASKAREMNGSGSIVINERSVSEITGLSRYSSRNTGGGGNEERERGAVARWMAWISQSRTAVRSGA